MADIVLIDDDDRLRERLALFLQQRGHDIHAFADGRDAMDVILEGAVDLVITDLNMPGMDGIEVIISLGEVAAGLPVIAMSGGGLFDKELLLDSADALGAVSTLEKPFDPALLLERIDSALSGASDRDGG